MVSRFRSLRFRGLGLRVINFLELPQGSYVVYKDIDSRLRVIGR